jgi:hypothetical protein
MTVTCKDEALCQEVRKYLKLKKDILMQQDTDRTKQYLKSSYYCDYHSGKNVPGTRAVAGDIIMAEFGESFNKEVGAEHPAIVMSVYYGKIFVIPMTSNTTTFDNAYDAVRNPTGRKNLMPIKFNCLEKQSTLFLNDAKYISNARIIAILGHISSTSREYKDIKDRLNEILNGNPMEMYRK